MGRAGYTDDMDDDLWMYIRWRGAVKAALRGKRGQLFLREMLAALDALSAPRLIKDNLVDKNMGYCAIGAVGLARGCNLMDMDCLSVLEDNEGTAKLFGIAEAMVREIEFINDECDEPWTHPGRHEDTPEERFIRVRRWVVSQINDEVASEPSSTD